MNEQEAKERCEALAAEHPDRESHRWVAVQAKGEWQVAKLNIPPAKPPSGTETRETKSESGDDPRILPPWLDPPRGGIV